MLCFSKLQQTSEHPWQKQLLLPVLSLSQGETQGHCFYPKPQTHSCTLGRSYSPTSFYASAQTKTDAPFSPGKIGSCPPPLPELWVLPTGSIRVCENQGVKLLGITAIPLNAGGAMLDLEG